MNDAISFFDQKSLSYVYENGWEFTNFFDGHTRITEVAARGVLHEPVKITRVGDDLFFVAWVDEEMGPISQVFDFKAGCMWASVPWEGDVQVWPAKITSFVEGRT